jgi:erythromycin esterase
MITAKKLLKDYYPLKSSMDLDPLLEKIGASRYVLLGEASHGTHEYYTWRAAISKRLIQEQAFSFIAVEGDWPDCYRINRYVKGYSDTGQTALEVLKEFKRWPTWMWANWEIAALMEWLREYNKSRPVDKKVGFYGLDVYSLWESMDVIINYLRKEDPKSAKLAIDAIRCFEPYEEGQDYAKAMLDLSADCTGEVVRLLQAVRKRSPNYDHDREASLNAEMNAQVIANAEEYYRSMVSFRDRSWNIRDSHMVETLEAIMEFHGQRAKGIVWEHNTHVGDARYADMRDEGMWNVGQLVREKHAKDAGVFIVGFSSYEGSAMAGRMWWYHATNECTACHERQC